MKNYIVVIITTLFMLAAVNVLAAKVDVTGKWEITSQSPRGEYTRTVEMIQKGEDLTVKMTTRRGDEMEAKGTVKDNKIEWSVTRETPRGEFTINYSGTVEGDTMKGTAEVGGRGSMEWTAKKVKEKN
jgi:autotransporter translocation and assembly factor TamB